MTRPNTARFGVGLKIVSAAGSTLAWSNVPAGGQAIAHVGFVPPTRGLHDLPSLSAETRFPLGLFRAWTVWRPAARLMVYPQAEAGAPEPPAALPVPGGAQHSRAAEGSEVEGVRAYRRGDALKRIAWRKSAQSLQSRGELISRDTSTSLHREVWLDWAACRSLPAEERLSRLAAWTLAADRAGVDYGLRLPGCELPTGNGESQRRLCLEALALWR
jgi:uncharacterized protein (DUF58 family)